VSAQEERAKEQLREIARDLEAIRYRLVGVHATLPPALEEVVAPLEIEEEMAASTHIRSVIEILLEDKIEPAIRDLREVSALPGSP